MGHKDQKEALIEEARQYLLGYWVLKRDQKLPNITPPKYEAYEAFLACGMIAPPTCFQNILDIDEEFLLAWVGLSSASVRWNDDSLYQVTKAYIEDNWNRCTEYEKSFFRYSAAMREGNYQAAFEAIEANYQQDPNDIDALHQAAFTAVAVLNKPHTAIEHYEQLFAKLHLFGDKIGSGSFYHYLEALNRIKEFKKVTDFYFDLSEELKKQAGTGTARNVMIALLYQDRIEDTKQFIEHRGNRKIDYAFASYAYEYIFPNSSINPFAAGYSSLLDASQNPLHIRSGVSGSFRDVNSLVFAYYVLKEWEKAEKLLLLLQKEDWRTHGWGGSQGHQHELYVDGLLGAVYARQDKREEALRQIKKIKDNSPTYPIISYGLRGSQAYLMARIYSILGEKEKALEQLHISHKQGRIFIWNNFYFDLDFANLKGYEPFEELIRPKG